MKRIGNLYEKICSIENLQLADEKARKGKLRTYGVIEHDKNREANLYLTYFDHWIKEQKRVKHYFRYADDIVILASDKSYLHSLMGEIRAYLGDLKLEVKGNWQVFPVAARGIDFVGYVFFHTHTRMRKGIKKTFCRRLAKLNKRKRPLSEKDFKQAICPWWGWAKSCDSKHLIKKLSKTSKYEIKFKR